MYSNGIYQDYEKIGTKYSQHILDQDKLLLVTISMILISCGMGFLLFHWFPVMLLGSYLLIVSS